MVASLGHKGHLFLADQADSIYAQKLQQKRSRLLVSESPVIPEID